MSGNASDKAQNAAAINQIWRDYKRSGAVELRNQLIEQYLPQVRYLAERMSSRLLDHVETDDLRQAGVFGLMDAVDKFDPDRGVKFETYCQQRVTGAMLDSVRSNDWVPRLVRARAAKLDRASDELYRALGREPTEEEIAEHLSMSANEYERFARDASASSIFSYDAPVTSGEGSERKRDRRLDVIEDPRHSAMIDELHKKEVLEKITDNLSEKERLVLILYYYEKLTLKEIGQVLDLSESRVCQIHSAMVNRLRVQLSRMMDELH
ncbi:FliA/WhiG family RNA polymerase sigma factor [bacterium AH-315-M10]|nr:FliA/WhiG family RNA polymerase sigma factor [bacterium AH-315-M10]